MIIEMPVEIKGLLSYLITQGLKALWNLFGKDFGGGAAAFAAIVIGAILFFFEGLLALIPEDQIELVNHRVRCSMEEPLCERRDSGIGRRRARCCKPCLVSNRQLFLYLSRVWFAGCLRATLNPQRRPAVHQNGQKSTPQSRSAVRQTNESGSQNSDPVAMEPKPGVLAAIRSAPRSRRRTQGVAATSRRLARQ